MRFTPWLLSLSFVSAGFAQSTPMKIGGVTVTGSLRMRGYGWNWFEVSSGENQYGYSGNLLRVNFAGRRKNWDWDAEVGAPFLLGLPDSATVPAPQGALGLGSNYFTANGNSRFAGSAFLKQAYIRFRGLGSEGATLQVGRFDFNDATEIVPKDGTLAAVKRDRLSQRLIGTFGWSDVGRSFDGLHFSYSKPKEDFTFVAAIPTRGVFQTDGWGWNRVGFGYAAFTHEWGHGKHSADTRVFALSYDDWRPILKTDNRPLSVRRASLSNIRLETLGGHTIHSFATSAGTIDAVAWGALQTGRWGTQTHRAYSFDFEAGYQPKILPRLKPWIRGGYTAGSGDGNPGDNRHSTFFQVLPTPRPYARFPFFNMMNTQDAFGAAILRLHPKVTVSSEFHSLRLSKAADLWYSGGGVFQPWTFGYAGRDGSGRRSLANLYDASAEFRAARQLTLTGYFGYAQGRAVMERIYPLGKDATFGYLEALFRF
jgi:hypothetical protein